MITTGPQTHQSAKKTIKERVFSMCFGLPCTQSKQIKYFWLNGFKRKKRVDLNSHFMAKVLRGVAQSFKISGLKFYLLI